MGSLIKNVFFLVTFAVILWFGYKVFFTGETAVLTDNGANPAVLAQNDFLSQLKELRDLKLDTSLFDDPEFGSLTDRRVEVVEEDAGRTNPFARVPGLNISSEATPTR